MEIFALLICACMSIGLINVLISLNITTSQNSSIFIRNNKRKFFSSDHHLMENEAENCLRHQLNINSNNFGNMLNFTSESTLSIKNIKNSCKYFEYLSFPEPREKYPPYTYRYSLEINS